MVRFDPYSKAKLRLMCLTLIFLLLSGCVKSPQEEELGNPSPADFLENEDADIFVLGSIVYSNARDLEWVKELDYTIGEQIGEITNQSSEAKDFKSGTSNKLPNGTKIYETDTPAYIVIVEGTEIPYIAMIEG